MAATRAVSLVALLAGLLCTVEANQECEREGRSTTRSEAMFIQQATKVRAATGLPPGAVLKAQRSGNSSQPKRKDDHREPSRRVSEKRVQHYGSNASTGPSWELKRSHSHHDIFPHKHAHPPDGDEGLNFLRSRPLGDWLLLSAMCLLLFLLDLYVAQTPSRTCVHHAATIGVAILTAMLFNALVYYREGWVPATEWCSGYVLEWMLSIDNLMVFHFIFSTYKTPADQIHKALSIGILGAILLRMTFFMVVSSLMHVFVWVRIPFGLVLIWSGVEACRGDDADSDVENTLVVRSLRACLGSRLSKGYDTNEKRFFVLDDSGRIQATLLVVVVACLEGVDVVFAFDSVTAKIAQIPDLYIAFSSSVFAMFGLRATFFVLQELMDALDLVQYGVAIILIFIGVELCLSHYLDVSASTVCVIVLTVFATSILGSIARQRFKFETAPETSRSSSG